MLIFTPLVIMLAHRMGWVAHPRKDRWHVRPTALMGGMAIFLAVSLTMVVFTRPAGLWWVWVGAALLFVLGLADDLTGMRPAIKLLVQLLAACLLIGAGYSLLSGFSPWISWPLTMLWVIGITNALNLLDNMDGLAAGIAGIASVLMAGLSAAMGYWHIAVFMITVAGASLAFLWFNFNPARIFMGDCGSLFLGYLIAAGGVIIQPHLGEGTTLAVFLILAAVMVVPIFDTTLVTFDRLISGRSLIKGGSDHSSHRLVLLGLSESAAVLCLYGISLLFGSLAILVHVWDVLIFYGVFTVLVAGIAVFGVYLASVRKG